MDILVPLYTDIRQYLIAALELTEPEKVVRAYNNNVPIPENAIIMSFREDKNLDQASTRYVEDKMIVFDSVSGTMQIDFYGEGSYDKARRIATLWHSPYTTSTLINCVPLNIPRVRDLTFENEEGLYELRFMLDLELQYNTKYEKTVTILTDVSKINVEPISNV